MCILNLGNVHTYIHTTLQNSVFLLILNFCILHPSLFQQQKFSKYYLITKCNIFFAQTHNKQGRVIVFAMQGSLDQCHSLLKSKLKSTAS